MQWIKRFFLPISANISFSEKLFSATTGFFAIFCLGYISLYVVGEQALPYMTASIGAAAVLVFATPSSPLAQPWPVLGGQIISAFIGVSIVSSQLFLDPVIASAAALSLSIFVMYVTRCLHPPGGAAALAVILGGQQVQDLGYLYVIYPVALNAVLIIILGVVFNRFVPNRHYPAIEKEKASVSDVAGEWAVGTPKFKDEDLRKALNNMDSYISVSEQDLAQIYAAAMLNANKRRLGNVYCKDIMIKSPITFRFDDELEAAWNTLQKHNIKGAPVVDSYGHLIGIVTTTDYMRHATGHHSGNTMQEKLRKFLKPSTGLTSDKAEVVGQIMSEATSVAHENQHIVDLIPVFTEKRFHHMPVVDEKGKVVGVIARSAVMRSMLINRI
ncbi:MAG: HPP family protein [Gammaproteobacteria bacterium]|nr:HPP family protein [Gammaproteobacteria bacterium]